MVAEPWLPKRTALTLLSFSNGQLPAVGTSSGCSAPISSLVATKYDVHGPSYGHPLHGSKVLENRAMVRDAVSNRFFVVSAWFDAFAAILEHMSCIDKGGDQRWVHRVMVRQV